LANRLATSIFFYSRITSSASPGTNAELAVVDTKVGSLGRVEPLTKVDRVVWLSIGSLTDSRPHGVRTLIVEMDGVGLH
jgi:hypothetical protein